MAELVRVRIGDRVLNVGAAFAEKHELEVVEESTHKPDGTLRREARANGRPIKKKTSVDREAMAKKRAASASPTPEAASDGAPETAEEATE